jgi:hypothetical protein
VGFGGDFNNGYRIYNATDNDFNNDFWFQQGQACGGPTANNNVN